MCAYQPKVYKVLTVSYVDLNNYKYSLDFVYYRNITNDYPRQGLGQEVNLNLANNGQIAADALDNLILSCIQDIFGLPLVISYPCVFQEEENNFVASNISGAYKADFTVNLFPNVLDTPLQFRSYNIKCVSLIPLDVLQVPRHKDVPMTFATMEEANAFFALHIG